ncbi:MAG: leucine--tRNA ligase [Chloroflexaceae bacterium]|nr:leucine--tRNA ligase [Chloroflexaceae bacterium]
MSNEHSTQAATERYNPAVIEKKWQDRWAADQLYRTSEADKRPKYYILDFYPYPSGDGLSVGHCRNYVPTDVIARYYRMRGYNVLHPMGWDAFGLPAENAAIKQKTNPALLIQRFSANYKRQMSLIGTSYDWQREINSSQPDYYQWTQWIFLRLYHSWYDRRVDSARPIGELVAELARHGTSQLQLPLSETPISAADWQAMSAQQQQHVLGRFRLAYRSEATVNWDPVDKTVIANEEVQPDGTAWRSGAIVQRKVLQQWFFRITAYADRLHRDLDTVDWPESIIAMQRNWIGRSQGAEVIFHTEQGSPIIVFTTRPDTLWGATFLVLSPEHPLVAEVTTADQQAAIDAYIAQAREQSASTSGDDTEEKEKTGVYTGGYAMNPVNGARIPIWIADYVLMGYGTGAIMAVPAHDERDFAFALKFDLPIIPVIAHPNDQARSVLSAGSYTDGLEDALQQAGYHTLPQPDGSLLVQLTGAQANDYALHVQPYLVAGAWTAVAGAGWQFIFADAIIPFDSVAADQAIIQRIRANDPHVSQRTVMQLLHSIPAYQEVLYHSEYGVPINSGPISGLAGDQALDRTIDWLEQQGTGQRRRNYRMRDWLISRQRYWGTPIPICYTADGLEIPVDDASLPVTLPDVEHYEPTDTGQSPLALIDSWLHVTLPDGRKVTRETDTMGTFACSSWYYMRFTDPHNPEELAVRERLDYWLPVDMYVGGAEHAVMHLLYSRFWTKVLYDLGMVSFIEPFARLRNQGLILAGDGRKMSKSFHNVITPDEVVAEHGADSLRGYECFISDFELAVPWNTQGVPGIRRWLDRVWRITLTPQESPGQPTEFTERQLQRVIHQSIQRVERDILECKFNTMIAALMEFTNALYRARDAGLAGSAVWQQAIDVLLRLMAPVAPHIAEELWERLGQPYSIHLQPWPVADTELAAEDEVEVVLQINGKVRDKVLVAADTDEQTLERMALENERIREWIGDKTIRRVIVVPGKLVNVVI